MKNTNPINSGTIHHKNGSKQQIDLIWVINPIVLEKAYNNILLETFKD